jgi:hypothetical protein
MKYLAGFLSLVVTLTLILWVILLILGQTLFNVPTIEHNLATAQAYSVIAEQLPVTLAQAINDSASEQSKVQKSLEQAITPDYVQTKVNTTLVLLSNYYVKGNNTLPSLDLSDFGSRAAAAGLVFPASTFSQPITLIAGPSDTIYRGFGYYRESLWLTGIVSLVTLLGLIFICLKMRRMTSLITALSLTAVLAGALAIAVNYFTPRLFKLAPLSGPDIQPYVSTIHTFVVNMAQSVTLGFAFMSGIMIILAVLFLIIGHARNRRQTNPVKISHAS